MAALGAVLLTVTHPLWLPAIGRFLVLSEQPFQAGAVVVLAGDRFGRRVLKAAELVRQGFAPVVYVSGPAGYYGTHESDAAIAFAVKHGYPQSAFAGFPNECLSTDEEALMFAREIRKRGLKRYILVTSDYHTRRACWLFRRSLPELEMRCVAAPDEFFRAESWWKNRESRKITFLEVTKTFASWAGL